MDIKTRLNLGEDIFFLNEAKVIQSIVRGMLIFVEQDGSVLVKYLCNKDPDQRVNIKVSEDIAFKTKTALIKSL